MFNTKPLEDLARTLYTALPSGFQQAETDLQKTFKDILQAAFAKMDLVTREEFDVQIKVLARTREKVEALQHQIDSLLTK